MSNQQSPPSGFKDLLNSMMTRRWMISAMVLGGFMLIIAGMFTAIAMKTPMAAEWKELLLLLLGAFIGSYGKIIDYWFSDTDKDKMLVQKMDEEDGVSLSNTADMPVNNTPHAPLIPDAFTKAVEKIQNEPKLNDTYEQIPISSEVPPIPNETPKTEKKGIEIDEDGDGIMDGIDVDGDGIIDEYFDHRNCQHVWGDSDHNGEEECQICGKIKDPDHHDVTEG